MKIVKSTIGNTSRTATLGNYIIGSSYLKADPNNEIFLQEYGHYIQSQNLGPLYLLAVGAFSIGGTIFDPDNHKYQDCERDANYLAFKYFNRYVDGFYLTQDEYDYYKKKNIQKGWNFAMNLLSKDTQYKDYYKLNDHIDIKKSIDSSYIFLHF